MSWQDAIISIASIFFTASLVIQVYFGFKEKTGPIKYLTSVPTFAGLYAICLVYWSLSLYYSSIISFLSGTLWLILSLQRLIYNKKEKATL